MASNELRLKSQFFATVDEALQNLTLLICQTLPPVSLLAQVSLAPSFPS